MSTVAFIARDALGTNQHGTSTEGAPSVISTAGIKDISLNLVPADVESYTRRGNDLFLTLSDGTLLELDGFYAGGAIGPKNLFLSDQGDFIQVVLEDKPEGMLFASYEPIDVSGKWSAYDDMVFLDFDRVEPVVAPLAAPLLGGLGGLGAAAAGAALLVGGDDDDGTGGGTDGGTDTGDDDDGDGDDDDGDDTDDGDGDDGDDDGDDGDDTDDGDDGDDDGDDDTDDGDDDDGVITPTVNDAKDTYDVPEGDPDGVTISGTGEAGSSVEVTIGDVVVTTTIEEDGTWSVNIPTADLPDDGVYETVVDVVAPDGTVYEDLDGPTIDIDSEPPTVIITEGTQSVGDVVDGGEQASGTVISGTGEAGATVTLVIDGASQTTTVAADGTWSVTFTPDQIATGEYETGITITTTDPHGNSTTTTDVLEVDTETSVSIDTGLSGGDDIISAAEAAAGVAITGTAEAGASVVVTVEGVSRTTTADSDGNWTVTYEDGSLPAGEYDAAISVTSTDAVGNTATATSTIAVDTDAGFVQLSDDPIETDDIINAAERGDGVTITGTATPGETVTVTLGTATGTTVADADGNWSYDFAASEIPTGTDTLDVTASITDAVGNTESDSDTVGLDTEVLNFTSEELQATDDIVNLSELDAGFTLEGTVEPGSAVSVEIEGTTYDALVASDGTWSLKLDAGDLPAGTYSTVATITATDAAGNTATLTQGFDVDTEYNTPSVTGTSTDGVDNLTGITVAETGDTLTLNTLKSDGSTPSVGATELDLGSNTMLVFDEKVSDGTNLVITTEDGAGNRSSTVVLFEDNATQSSVLDHAGISGFNVDRINLEFAADVSLTLTEEDINALSGNSDTLTIVGGSDDTVTLTGAIAAGTQDVNGQTFNVYTIGDGDTTLLVEDDVNIII